MNNEWLERDLEDHVKRNPYELASVLFGDGAEEIEIIGTQVPCVFGRIDMLCTWRQKLLVIEFKAVSAGEKELGQVTRYASLIEKVLNPYRHLNASNFMEASSAVFVDVCPVLVAPYFDKRLFYSDCALILATQADDGEFYLESAGPSFAFKKTDEQNRELEEILGPYERYVAGRAIGRIISNALNGDA